MSMKKREKKLLINFLKEELKKFNAIYITDTSGLNSNSTFEFRKACYYNNIKVKVVKNTLFKRAIKETHFNEYNELSKYIKGNTTILLSNTSNSPAKLIQSFRKTSNKPILKVAWVDQSLYFNDISLNILSKLKSQHELIGEIIFSLKFPINKIMNLMQSSSFIISNIIKQISIKKNIKN